MRLKNTVSHVDHSEATSSIARLILQPSVSLFRQPQLHVDARISQCARSMVGSRRTPLSPTFEMLVSYSLLCLFQHHVCTMLHRFAVLSVGTIDSTSLGPEGLLGDVDVEKKCSLLCSALVRQFASEKLSRSEAVKHALCRRLARKPVPKESNCVP